MIDYSENLMQTALKKSKKVINQFKIRPKLRWNDFMEWRLYWESLAATIKAVKNRIKLD